jgi:enterochelin esterase-like enzyme
MPIASAAPLLPTRRASLIALAGFALAGCGGGGDDGDDGSTPRGTITSRSLVARSNGTAYNLNLWLPPDLASIRDTASVIYLLDGDSRFAATVEVVQGMQAKAIVVGIGNEAMRNRDYVPQNTCTPSGGGEAAYLDFIVSQLAPAIETDFGGDPRRRILLGHSHGGSFVFYALFNEAPATRHFAVYLASDASIDCMRATVDGWEADFHAANAALQVRLHISYGANLGNESFGQQIQGRAYTGLAMASRFYGGGHIGMIPSAFRDALAFALA